MPEPELSGYSRVTAEMASLVAKYKSLRALGWEIARESGKIKVFISLQARARKAMAKYCCSSPFPQSHSSRSQG